MFSVTMGIYWYRRKYHTTRQWHFTAGKRHFHRFQQNDTPMGVEISLIFGEFHEMFEVQVELEKNL